MPLGLQLYDGGLRTHAGPFKEVCIEPDVVMVDGVVIAISTTDDLWRLTETVGSWLKHRRIDRIKVVDHEED